MKTRITILLILMQSVLFSFPSNGQEKRSHIFIGTSLMQYGRENADGTIASGCQVDNTRYERGYCRAKLCSKTKRHLPGHCNCPAAGNTRVMNGKYYTLLNPCEPILLYKRVVNPTKWTSIEYYFSRIAEGEIIPLTKENLKNGFADNAAFQQRLDALFRSNSQLTWFDKLNNMYFINWVYTHVSRDVSDDRPSPL